ncbi:SMP-30/gluconolactonase/LRE family protein [Streptomyces indicus]|uniref:Sugar lactone lactonase YvrE n=1 Tax=Streptomyces indicus TaxID=417292 RepID=A0A1G8TXX8_9ACTN|nr:SMP-30/gluconolactonase/LRE family protein [Streptomyces indicus]SDJ45570.1 Sugar lactone lactonase YvrE [Streptomyces indicus]
MTKPTWTPIGATGAFYECPRWHEGVWWLSDFYADRIVTVTDDGRTTTVLDLEGDHPGGLGWLPDGALLFVAMRARQVMRREPDGSVVVHADLTPYCEGPANDMLVLPDGTALVGCFGFDLNGGEHPRTASLLSVRPDGAVRVAAEGLVFPNAAVLTDHGRTLVVGETFAARHTAFTLTPDGLLDGRRTWAQVAPSPPMAPVGEMIAGLRYAPDGCAVDGADDLWVADALHGRVVRVREGEGIVEQLDLPAGLRAFACGLGGDDGRTLLVCAAPDFDPSARAAARDSVLLTTRVRVPAA